MSYALVRVTRTHQGRRLGGGVGAGGGGIDSGLDLEAFARRGGVHPDLVRRLVRLGLLEPTRSGAGEMSFASGQLAALARIERLRAGAGLNYAAIGLVVDLLDRVARLETALRRTTNAGAQRQPEGSSRSAPGQPGPGGRSGRSGRPGYTARTGGVRRAQSRSDSRRSGGRPWTRTD